MGNEFYRLVLGPSMTYSCARFTTPATTLEDAQAAKHDLICRKLGLAAGPVSACSTSAADGGRWRSTPPATTARRSSA